jgi:predicted HTH domain antitoxin
MPHLTIDIPADSLAKLHRSLKELEAEIRLTAAMIWYTQGCISHERAAEFAGMSRIEFIDELADEVESAHEAIREHLSAGVAE